MENANALILALSAAVVIFILFRIAKKILKIVLIAAVLGIAFYLWQGGSVETLTDKGQASIEELQNLLDLSSYGALIQNNCPGRLRNQTRCICIIDPAMEDLNGRFSQEELKAMDSDPGRFKKEFRKSMLNQHTTIRKCLIKEKGPEYWSKLKEELKKAL